MCGRYVSVKSTANLLDEFDAVDETDGATTTSGYNVAPTTGIRIVVNRVPHGAPEEETEPVKQLRLARWGLVPSWAKDLSVGNRMFNARAESVPEKSAFSKAFARRRCLVPADGWYEWQKISTDKAGKQAYLMIPADGHTLAFAGLYEFWKPKDDPEADWLTSVTIITAAAQGELAEIHQRMPLVLARGDWARWLDPNQDGPTDLLQPQDEMAREGLELRPVSSKVNNVANNGPELLEREEPDPVAQALF
jgi:putative SOS response-associated peptidase YedK